ncbi:bifunctional DNA primase/polymerase [Stutzerimonas stutzeri]|uniref:Primase-like protein n=1 Tax=Stutzerimonas stutzeri TaxID=316 RepID=A0A5S5BAS8_STUST|nr:DUF5906 domain-containing protein [Stutzerimonas stutzeri]TYP64024.1 primase-like protein [Stutzerimonas stutzeri]
MESDNPTIESQSHSATSAAQRTPSFDVDGLIAAGLQLIPLHKWDAVDNRGRARGKTPRDGAWQAKEYDSIAVLAEATRTGRNIGVRLPASVVVLDVDPRNFLEGRDSLAEFASAHSLDLTLASHVITGSGGHHYYFKKPADVAVVDSLEDFPGLEFKSLGRQVVAPGSLHPCGERYEWDDFAPRPSEMQSLPSRILDLIRRPARAHGQAAGLGDLSPEQLAAALEFLDVEDFKEESHWRTLMMACHHATNGEGRQEFIDWSTQDPDYQDDAWIIGRRWDSLHSNPSGGRRGRPVTIKFLHKVVQEAGGHIAHPDPEDEFEPWLEESLGEGVDDAELRAEPKAEGLDGIIQELNGKHYAVLDSGFQIITEEADPIFNGRVRYQRLSKSDFRSMYENRLTEINNKLMSVADVWLKSPKRRQYKGIIFDPSRDHDGWLNMWQGWAYDPKEGNWSLLRQLVLEVLVDGVEEHYEYVLNWMAFLFQHPEKVAEVAIAFRGEKGTGKGTLGRTLHDIAGASGLHISSPGHLTGRFNSHLQNCVCLFADEAFWAGNKEGEAVLKQLVTEPTITYEGKGRDAVNGRNHVHIVMASNNDWVVPAGMDGERRFAVFNVNTNRKGDKAFFDALNKQLENGGRAAFLHDMLKRDIGNWHPRDNVPQTEALAEQKMMSQSAEESWWDDLLESGKLPGYAIADDDPPWHESAVEVDKDELHRDYLAYAKSIGARPRTKAGLAMKIKKKAGIGERQVVLEDGRRVWKWVLPGLSDARAIWAKATGKEE